jgi:Zn-dependent protease with chaperone function
MKRHIKKFITIALCFSMMQSTVYAGPFQDFARKWVARGAAVGYWGILGAPIGFNTMNNVSREAMDSYLKMTDDENKPFFKDLKDAYPSADEKLEEIYKENGLANLNGYTVKVTRPNDCASALIHLKEHPEKSLQTKMKRIPLLGSSDFISNFDVSLAVQALGVSAGSIGRKTIAISRDYINELGTLGVVAGVLAHEREHDERNHGTKKALFQSAIPFVIHGAAKAAYKAVGPLPVESHPSILRSLARIPRAGAIVVACTLLNSKQERDYERQADAAMQNAPVLAEIMSKSHRKYMENDRLLEQENKEKLQPYMGSYRAEYAAKHIMPLFNSHPSDTERAEYFEKWAKEAEAKKQQEEQNK